MFSHLKDAAGARRVACSCSAQDESVGVDEIAMAVAIEDWKTGIRCSEGKRPLRGLVSEWRIRRPYPGRKFYPAHRALMGATISPTESPWRKICVPRSRLRSTAAEAVAHLDRARRGHDPARSLLSGGNDIADSTVALLAR